MGTIFTAKVGATILKFGEIMHFRDKLRQEYAEIEEEIELLRRKMAVMVGRPTLFERNCPVCYTPECHESHQVKDTPAGGVYRAFSCGRRKEKPENLRYKRKAKIQFKFKEDGS